MKAKKIILSLVAMLGVGAFWAISANATNWYVRDGGGAYGTTSTTCNGQTNAVFTGSNGPNCAVSSPGYILGWGCYSGACDHNGIMVSGDTLYIDGDSDISTGNQAQYEIGYNNSTPGLFNNGKYGNCVSHANGGATYQCEMGEIPAGTTSQQTSVIGTGTHKPQLWGTGRIFYVLLDDNSYTTLQWLEITDHVACGYNAPFQQCNYSSAPYGDVAEQGISVTGTGINWADIYVHGMGSVGVNTGAMGSATFTRVWIIGNSFGGFIVGAGGNEAVTGTLTFNQPIIDWNGCIEQYPMQYPGIENPLNYSNCYGQGAGGYGDGLAFGATGHENAGNWTIIGPGSISWNTQDGEDILHGTFDVGTDYVDKMRFEGNAGNQVKVSGLNVSVTNSLIIGNCGWWQGAAQSAAGDMSYSAADACRAGASAIVFQVATGGNYTFYNNTIVDDYIGWETGDENNTGCSGGLTWNIYNNILLGGIQWNANTGINPAGEDTLVSYYFNDGYEGGGSCQSITPTEDYNIISGIKDTTHCTGAHDKCNTVPGFSSGTFPNGAAGAGQSSYYTGQSGATLVSLGTSSQAIAAGVSGLSYWNNGNDYHNISRASPPSIGALELNSCSATGNGCFFNTDCCSGTCSNFLCTGGSVNYGDVTGSGNVTINDAELTAQYSIGMTVANFNSTAAKVDGNSKVDIYDAYLIAEYALGIISKFPVET